MNISNCRSWILLAGNQACLEKDKFMILMTRIPVICINANTLLVLRAPRSKCRQAVRKMRFPCGHRQLQTGVSGTGGCEVDRVRNQRAGEGTQHYYYMRCRWRPIACALLGGNQTRLEKAAHPWVGSPDPSPITAYTTLTL